jgi:iron(III) transport system ATP-binding protein
MNLHIKDLTFAYGQKTPRIFEHFNLTVEQGQILAILGRSGSGKSTLLRIIAGLETKAEGEILLGDKVCQSRSVFTPVEKRNVGFVFQDYALFPFLSVIDNIRFGQKKPDREALANLLALTQLAGLEKRYPQDLSGGQQQRTALARSLAADPAILLLDEPFSNLDTELVADMRTDLKRIVRTRNMTTILVTHNLSDANQLADQILTLA